MQKRLAVPEAESEGRRRAFSNMQQEVRFGVMRKRVREPQGISHLCTDFDAFKEVRNFEKLFILGKRIKYLLLALSGYDVEVRAVQSYGRRLIAVSSCYVVCL